MNYYINGNPCSEQEYNNHYAKFDLSENYKQRPLQSPGFWKFIFLAFKSLVAK